MRSVVRFDTGVVADSVEVAAVWDEAAFFRSSGGIGIGFATVFLLGGVMVVGKTGAGAASVADGRSRRSVARKRVRRVDIGTGVRIL